MEINLARCDKDTSPVRIIKYPDGQQDVVLDPKRFASLSKPEVNIKTRLTSWKDLELLVCCVKSLNELGINKIHLYIVYFLGARSDRKFLTGGNWYLKDVICPIINSLEAKTVRVLTPHSDVLGNLLNNYVIDADDDFTQFEYQPRYHFKDNNLCLISPDAGGYKRVDKFRARYFPFAPIAVGVKTRDRNGKLSGTHIYGLPPEHAGLIIDDLCDGGRTFEELAKQFKKTNSNPLYLLVTHAIFSAGLERFNLFDQVHLTNSYNDWPTTDCFKVRQVI